MTNDELDPVEEIRAIRKKNMRKFKTLDAYFDHLKTIPPADVLLARIRRKNRKILASNADSAEKKKRADIPFFGMWADRKDMDDPAETTNRP